MHHKKLRALQANGKKYVRATPPADVCVAIAQDVPPGIYRFLPTAGWLQRSNIHTKTDDVCLLLGGFLLHTYTDEKVLGALTWSIPCTEANQTRVWGLLEALGWNGHVFPSYTAEPAPWPTEQDEIDGLRMILKGRQLDRTLTFPPGANGSQVVTVAVTATNRLFPLGSLARTDGAPNDFPTWDNPSPPPFDPQLKDLEELPELFT